MTTRNDLSTHDVGPSIDSTSELAEPYLVYRLRDGLYASLLLEVREVVEYKTPKPIPNTKSSFLGVINIRGDIVGLVDLSAHLGGPPAGNGRPTLLVVNSAGGTLAAVVDEVVSVVHIAPGAVDAASRETSPDRPLRGVARLEGSLVTLLDLARIMEDGDLAMFTRRAA